MKKMLCKIWDGIFGSIFAMLLALFLALCAIVVLPIDYIRYKRSLYYKTLRKKYEPYAATGIHFDIYNAVLKYDLPIKYIENPNSDNLECGWFVYGQTLIIPNVFDFELDAQSGKWNYCVETEEEGVTEKRVIMPLDEYWETELQEANELAGQNICQDAVVLIDAKCIENAELAKQESRFLIYDAKIEDALKNLCK